MTIPDELLASTATVTPAVGDPFDLPCYVQRAQDFPVDPTGEDSVPAYSILANSDVAVPAGANIAFDGRNAIAVKIIPVDSGDITGLAHQEITAISIRDLAEARALQEAQMTAACTVSRNTGVTAYDPVTHQNQPVWDTVYTGKCRIQPVSRNSPVVAALFGQQINIMNQIGALPITVTDVKAGDVLEVTVSDDLGQVGHKYTIQEVQSSSVAVARRFIAVENQG